MVSHSFGHPASWVSQRCLGLLAGPVSGPLTAEDMDLVLFGIMTVWALSDRSEHGPDIPEDWKTRGRKKKGCQI